MSKTRPARTAIAVRRGKWVAGEQVSQKPYATKEPIATHPAKQRHDIAFQACASAKRDQRHLVARADYAISPQVQLGGSSSGAPVQKKPASDKTKGLEDEARYAVKLCGDAEHKTVKPPEWLSLLHDKLARIVAKILYTRKTSKPEKQDLDPSGPAT